MPLYREGSLQPVDATGPAPLPLEEWLKAPMQAVSLANTDQPDALSMRLSRLKLVVLHFPKFTDGRAYSQARLLRGRMGYRGELRATGAVLRDQLPFLLRCGFDSFESDQPGFGVALARARSLFSVVYQGAEDNRATVALLRLRQHRQPAELAAD
ncbi:MAG: DUF934 domain-containing protein [Proteobacteria bacterium]|nr:DUF934 domain-containing protein [Pseudomonadota bacterium]